MKALFVGAEKFNVMKARAEQAEATLASIKEIFGADADAEGFDLLAAIQSLGKEDAPTEVKPNAKLAAVATKFNIEPEGDDDDAIIDAIEERMQAYSEVTLPPKNAKGKKEELDGPKEYHSELEEYAAEFKASN